MEPRRMRSPVAVANEHVSIALVCRLVGMSVPDGIPEGRSVKLHCPFGAFYHSDFGVETAFRVYPSTNSAYCFAGCGYYSPVKLYAAVNDLTYVEAAERLLELADYRPIDVVRRWDQVVGERPLEVDQPSLAEALKLYCSRIDPEWEVRQFEPAVAVMLARCFELIPRIRTEAEALQWREATKQVMQDTLRRDNEVE